FCLGCAAAVLERQVGRGDELAHGSAGFRMLRERRFTDTLHQFDHRSSVVLPAPRKPESTVTGSRRSMVSTLIGMLVESVLERDIMMFRNSLHVGRARTTRW